LPAPPQELRSLIEATFGTGIVFEDAQPECIVRLDDFEGEHRNCDLVILCRRGSLRIVISVEAKADEPFGETIGDYYDAKLNTSSNVPKRIVQLSTALFGRVPDETIRNLRYQLLHAAAGALIEAISQGANCAVFLVHEFHSPDLNLEKVEHNMADWTNFVKAFPALASMAVGRNQSFGPVSVPGLGRVSGSIPLYLGSVVTELPAHS
jgi:hypothetical protein